MIIRLKDVDFFAYHGVFPEEKSKGNTFRVNLSVELPENTLGCSTDSINDTLNYQVLYDIVANEMTTTSDLLENVAMRIKNTIISRFPTISNVRVAVAKKNPPLGGNVAWAEVEL